MDFLVELAILIEYRNRHGLLVMPNRSDPQLNIDELIQEKGKLLSWLNTQSYPKAILMQRLVSDASTLYILQRAKNHDDTDKYSHDTKQNEKMNVVVTHALDSIQDGAPDVSQKLRALFDAGNIRVLSSLSPQEFQTWTNEVQPRTKISFGSNGKAEFSLDTQGLSDIQAQKISQTFNFLATKMNQNVTAIDGSRDQNLVTMKILEHPNFKNMLFFTDYFLLTEFLPGYSEYAYGINTSKRPSHLRYSSYYRDAVNLVDLYPESYPFTGAQMVHEYGHLLQYYQDPVLRISIANILDENSINKYWVVSQVALQAAYLNSMGYLSQIDGLTEGLRNTNIKIDREATESSAQFYMLDQTVLYLAK